MSNRYYPIWGFPFHFTIISTSIYIHRELSHKSDNFQRQTTASSLHIWTELHSRFFSRKALNNCGLLWGALQRRYGGLNFLGFAPQSLAFARYFIVCFLLCRRWPTRIRLFVARFVFGPLGRCLVYKSGFLLGSSYQLNPAQRTAHTRVCKRNLRNPENQTMAFFKVSEQDIIALW